MLVGGDARGIVGTTVGGHWGQRRRRRQFDPGVGAPSGLGAPAGVMAASGGGGYHALVGVRAARAVRATPPTAARA